MGAAGEFEIGKDGVGTVVVGYDESPPSVHAAAWASGLVRREGGLLVIVYVEALKSPAYWSSFSVSAAVQTAQEIVDELRAQAAEYLDARGIHWDMVHGRGEPAMVLEAIAEERRADCIVVGRSRRTGALLGSVPRSLLARSKRPVVVVP
ncbi:MAG TPA: universal stress protein [Pseudonocardiaceae bacterium]|nr:universal stress protein [Pseudonocardiaceae bacterium]